MNNQNPQPRSRGASLNLTQQRSSGSISGNNFSLRHSPFYQEAISKGRGNQHKYQNMKNSMYSKQSEEVDIENMPKPGSFL